MRALSQMEQAWTLTDRAYPLTTVSVLNLRPGPGPDALRAALAQLQSLIPALRVSIQHKKGALRFVEADPCPPIPLEVIDRHGPEQWEKVARQQLNQSVPPDQAPLMRVHYLWSADGQADMVLAFHHAFGDAHSLAAWIHQLLRFCVDPHDQPIREAFTFLPGSEDLFPLDFRGWRILLHLPGFLLRQLRSEWAHRRANRHLPQQPIPAKAANAILYLSFSQEISGKLIRISRQQGVSMPGMLAAAMLLAVQHHRYEGKPGSFRSIIFAELRPYLRPPVAPQRPGCYLSMFRLTERVPERISLMELALRLSRQIYAAGKRGERFLYAFLSKTLVQTTLRMGNQRLGNTALSYAGPLPLQPRYGDFHLRNVHGFITNNPMGAEYTAFGKLWDGRLELDIQYLEAELSEEEARQIAEYIQTLLEETAASTPDNPSSKL